MNQLIVAFFTGLTTGGLSCLAVQGGLLASSLEHQLEQQLDLQLEQEIAAHRARRSGKNRNRVLVHPRLAVPILLFLAAKLVAYTLLGFLLGALGSVLQLNAIARAILLIAIGIFMVGNALRMFNVHPIFRYFSIEPPKFITRFIRRKAKNGESELAPLLLGALTVFIPCGVTQAMMAVAIGTGSALQGAVLMFAFILGTSPVFFTVAYLAMKLGSRLEKWFMRFVAAVLLVLGLISVNSGLTLMGSPLSLTNMIETAKASQPVAASDPSLPSIGRHKLIRECWEQRLLAASPACPGEHSDYVEPGDKSNVCLLALVRHPLTRGRETLALIGHFNHFHPGSDCRYDHTVLMFDGHVYRRDCF